MKKISDYTNIFYAGRNFTVSEFFKLFPDCNVKKVIDLTKETVGEGVDKYTHKLKGCAQTSMGEFEVFNYSDLS